MGSAFTLSLFYGFNSVFLKIIKSNGYIDENIPTILIFLSGSLAALI